MLEEHQNDARPRGRRRVAVTLVAALLAALLPAVAPPEVVAIARAVLSAS